MCGVIMLLYNSSKTFTVSLEEIVILELKDRGGVWSNYGDSGLISRKIGYNFALESENKPFRVG